MDVTHLTRNLRQAVPEMLWSLIFITWSRNWAGSSPSASPRASAMFPCRATGRLPYLSILTGLHPSRKTFFSHACVSSCEKSLSHSPQTSPYFLHGQLVLVCLVLFWLAQALGTPLVPGKFDLVVSLLAPHGPELGHMSIP